MSDEVMLLKVEEAAQRLALSRSVVYDLLRRGAIRSVLIGRSRRVPVTALQAFVGALESEYRGTLS